MPFLDIFNIMLKKKPFQKLRTPRCCIGCSLFLLKYLNQIVSLFSTKSLYKASQLYFRFVSLKLLFKKNHYIKDYILLT